MPRVLGIAHQRARILLRKTRSKIRAKSGQTKGALLSEKILWGSPKGSHFAPQNKE